MRWLFLNNCDVQSAVFLDCSSPWVWGHSQKLSVRLCGEQLLLNHPAGQRCAEGAGCAVPVTKLKLCRAVPAGGELEPRTASALRRYFVGEAAECRRANLSSFGRRQRQGAQLKFSFTWKSCDGEFRASALQAQGSQQRQLHISMP